ncbi:MAG: hypothetical protein Q7U04_14110 [Bacteriovorax sp.]|nr:hypothetical protein [Bacteriovorax sp.]
MKNWLYVPFLVLMAITYTRVTENISENSADPIIPFSSVSRGPASFELNVQEECLDLPSRFNPHFITEKCK